MLQPQECNNTFQVIVRYWCKFFTILSFIKTYRWVKDCETLQMNYHDRENVSYR
jgi:hypothetical protein